MQKQTNASNVPSRRKSAVGILGIAAFLLSFANASAQDPVERGKYLVGIAGCNDCHTPGYFLGRPDQDRYLGGSDVGFFVPGLGTFVGPNLTSDRETGIGAWSRDQIVTALQAGTTPDGRELAPIMPWRAFAGLTKEDAYAIADYLKTLPPLKHKVPGPFGPNEEATLPVFKIAMPADGK
ncbi:c-type cytochrome [Rhizobium sp. BK251]|uniref:c-type cytochrome n=1 Tax=Rhizobium sp. BK251 TaxID=2512125 RepID=UPI00104BB4E2|nr:c-type cytochrome [Rhizobium sp. BK251]TCL71339.1 cytochrome c [Rhizobium sp. BK251]